MIKDDVNLLIPWIGILGLFLFFATIGIRERKGWTRGLFGIIALQCIMVAAFAVWVPVVAKGFNISILIGLVSLAISFSPVLVYGFVRGVLLGHKITDRHYTKMALAWGILYVVPFVFAACYFSSFGKGH